VLQCHSEMEFSYKLKGAGWGEARVGDAANHVLLPTSYLTDVLSELLQAVGTLLEGAWSAQCSWEEEPGEYRWLFERRDGRVSVRILAFSSQYPPQPDGAGTLVFETECSLMEAASAIAGGCEQVLVEHGEAGYKEKWIEHPFPTEILKMVKATLTDP